MTINRALARRAAAAVLGAAALAACEGGSGVQDITAPVTGAAVKFFNFGVSAPSVNFFANETKVTAISSTSCVGSTASACLTTGIEATTGVASGAAGNNAMYNALTAGQYTLAGKIVGATDNGLAISGTTASLESGKYYSYYLSGLYDATAKKVEGFVVEDPIPATIDPTRTYIRFVNAISNSAPLTLWIRTANFADLAVAGSTAYKGASTFASFGGGGIVDVVAKTAAGTDFIVRTGVSFGVGRVYTITARGDATVSSTGTAATRPQLDNTANR